MQEGAGKVVASGLPEDVGLPTQEEMEGALREAEEKRIKELKELRKKIRGAGPEVLNIAITI